MYEKNSLPEEVIDLRRQVAELEEKLKAQRKEIEQLQKAYRTRDSLFALNLDILCVAGLDGYFQQFNPALENILGYSTQELLSQPFIEFVHPDDRATTLAAVTRLSEGSEVVGFENRYRCQDGSYRWLSWNAVSDRENQVIYATSRDVTQSKETEAKLEEKAQLLRSVYDGVEHLIFVLDVLENGEFRYVGWNSQTEKFANIGSTEIAGKKPEDWLGPEAGAEISRRLQDCVEIRKALTIEECLVRAGEKTWWQTTFNPLRDSSGRIYRIVGTTFNISDRKATEQALRESEGKYQQILDAITDSVLVKGPESRIVWANKAFREYYGMTNEQLENTIDADFNKPDYTLQYIKDDTYVFETGQTLEIEEPVTRYDGEVRFFSTIKSAIRNEEGEVILTVGVARDITERQAAREALRQSETQLREQARRLEITLHELQRTQAQLIHSEKMSSLGQMVAGIAHEINNPISFIYSNVDHATDYLQDLLYLIEIYQQSYPNPTEEVSDAVTQIDLDFLVDDWSKLMGSMKSGAQRIRDIVLSLKNFSRLHESDMKPVDIHDGIESTLLIIQNRLSGAGIEVIKEYSQLPQVTCYASDLNQVFLHILNNAIEALLMVKSRSLQIQLHTDITGDETVKIAIADNGPGMTPKVRSRIFDPFFTTKPVGSGTGLGLAVSYQIVVEKHGGSLTCISALGQGTEFIIEIPIIPKN